VPSRTDYGQNAFATPTTRRARHSTTGVVTPQRTPVTITYSPHMSEAAPPSRSSMTPFDAAANRRDALAAEAAAERKRRRASVMPEGERGEKKKRFVRTKPIWQR
jgi:hypothetical protein